MTRHLYRVLCGPLLGVGLLLSGCAPPIYFAKETRGTVVDAETKQPIVGAVIVANWDLYTWGITEGTHGLNSLQVTEVVTDAHGNYALPGWGPKLRPCFTYLDSRDPELMVFKSGYDPRWVRSDRRRNTWVRVSDWNGRAIELSPFRETAERRLDRLSMVVSEGLHCAVPFNKPYRAASLSNLYDEILKEQPFLSPAGRGLFLRAERLRAGGD